MRPCSLSEDKACSRVNLVANGQTGALFLLSVIVVGAFFVGVPDIKRCWVSTGRFSAKASWLDSAFYTYPAVNRRLY